jgi:hypothetical protein
MKAIIRNCLTICLTIKYSDVDETTVKTWEYFDELHSVTKLDILSDAIYDLEQMAEAIKLDMDKHYAERRANKVQETTQTNT